MIKPEKIESLKRRIMRLQERQNKSMSVMNQLRRIFIKLETTEQPDPETEQSASEIEQPAPEVEQPAPETETITVFPDLLLDHSYEIPDSFLQLASPTTIQDFYRYAVKREITYNTPCSPSISYLTNENDNFDGYSFKRKHEEDIEYSSPEGDKMITLGPNGTQLHLKTYNNIIWSSAATATRQLLNSIFTIDILGTHTLSGKPSPAFHGREKPEKKQLDPFKVADIIWCVRSNIKCSEREIRATITTRCSDASKTYKKRLQKQLETSYAMK